MKHKIQIQILAQSIGVMCPGANLSFPEAEIFFLLKAVKGFPGSPVVKNLPAVQETQESRVRSLGWEDPLEQEMATHCRILAWKTPWAEKPGGLQFSD